MKLISCRVQNYRSIIDSGWVDIDDIAVIVGKNESGKTSFLKALSKLNSFDITKYNIDREFPRGRRKDRSLDKVVASTKFEFTSDEIKQITAIHESAIGITGVEVVKNYDGRYLHTFSPKGPDEKHKIDWVVDLIEQSLSKLPEGISPNFKSRFETRRDEIRTESKEKGVEFALSALNDLKQQLQSFINPQHPFHQTDRNLIPSINSLIDNLIDQLNKTPLLRVVDYVHQRMPIFVYMDDYRMFYGRSHLNDLNEKKNRDGLIQMMKQFLSS